MSGNIFAANLQRLSLKHNKINTIKNFDLSLSIFIRIIDLSHNELSQNLPSVFFNNSNFSKLNKIDLSHNKFTIFLIITENRFSPPKEIILNDNAIQGEIDLLNFEILINLNSNNNQLSLVTCFKIEAKDGVVSLKNNNHIHKIDCKFFNDKMSDNPNILLEDNPGYPVFGLTLTQKTSDYRQCKAN